MLVLLVLLVLLVFFLILLFVLLFFLLVEFLQEFLHDVAVFLRLFVFRVEVEGLGVLFDGVFPVRLLGRFIAGCLAAADERVGEIVGGILAQLVVLGEKRARKVGDRLFKIPEFVGGGSGVELHLARIR